MSKPRTSTTKLPQALREQIDASAETKHHVVLNRKRSKVNRKEARKQVREDKRQRKAEFFEHSRKRPADSTIDDSPPSKKTRISGPKSPTLTLTSSTAPLKPALKSQPREGVNTQNGAKTPKLPPILTASRSKPEKDEDAKIAWLEAQLGAGGKKEKKLWNDGFDDLVDDLDKIFHPDVGENDSREEEEEDGVTQSEEGGFEETHDALELGEDTESSDASEAPALLDRSGIIIDDSATATQDRIVRYVPPQLRKAPVEEHTEKLTKLMRPLKGLLNRLSEQNIATVVTELEVLYRTNPRHDVTTAITRLIIDGVSSSSTHLDSFLILHGSLVAALHKVIGIDFAAHFVQTVVTAYEGHYSATDSSTSSDNGKEPTNLLLLLSQLYNLQVISCLLIYDIIRTLLASRLTELDIDLLLQVSRSSGFQLRQDDPLALKDIIQMLQERLVEKDGLTSRTKFLVETLTDLKINKIKQKHSERVQFTANDAVERMKRYLSTLSKKHHGHGTEPLRVSLQDLHSSDTRGKWWLVGAAWAGDPLVDRQKKIVQPLSHQPADDNNDVILSLARKQGMNTDVRRSIFVILMTSEDYIDACDRLGQLNLTDLQQREIIRVILHCCGNEKLYNPYYTLIVQRLCQDSHSYKVTLQFCLWDFLRDLGEPEVGGAEITKNQQEGRSSFGLKSVSDARIRNVSKAYAWWVAKGALSIAILKPVNFAIIRPQTKQFMHNFFTQLFVSSQVSSPAFLLSSLVSAAKQREALEQVFFKAARVPSLTQGLIFAIRSYACVDALGLGDDVKKVVLWAADVAIGTLQAGHAVQELDL